MLPPIHDLQQHGLILPFSICLDPIDNVASLAMWLSRSSQEITTVDLTDTRMNRYDRRAHERHTKKTLTSQMKQFRPIPILSPHAHNRFIRCRA